MSRVILCCGNKAKTPYVFRTSGVKVYTIEELCYCLKTNLDLLEEDTIDREMAMFIKLSLGLKERGDLLDHLILTKADLKSKLVVIFCSCDFFDEDEIRSICNELDELSNMSKVSRRKRRADKYMEQGKCSIAKQEYNSILADRDSINLSPAEYGLILHNLAVIEANAGHFIQAAELFREAYERNSNRESLKSYIYALKLGRRSDDYIVEAMRLFDNRDLLDEIEDEISVLEDNLEQSGEMDDVNRLKVLLAQGRASEFDRLAEEMITGLKSNYRNSEDIGG